MVQADGSRVFVGFISREKLQMLLAKAEANQAKAEAEHRAAEHKAYVAAMHTVRTGSCMGAAPTGANSLPGSPQRRRRNSLPGRLSPLKRPCRLELGASRGEASGHGPEHCSGDSSAEPSMRGGSVWGGNVWGGSFRKHSLGSRESTGTTWGTTTAQAEAHPRRPSSGGSKPKPASRQSPQRERRNSLPGLLSRGMHGLHPDKRRQHAAFPDVKKRQHVRQHSRPTIDLLPYCDRAPFTVHELLPLYMVSVATVSVATVSVATVSVAIVSVAIVSVAIVSVAHSKCSHSKCSHCKYELLSLHTVTHLTTSIGLAPSPMVTASLTYGCR